MSSHANPTNGHSECLPFQPPVDRHDRDLVALHQSFRRVPRYLFRTHCVDSKGVTNTSAVLSEHCRHNPDDYSDLFDFDEEIAALELRDHLRWQRYSPSKLVSWTSSLPFAIQLGLYRRAKQGRALSDIYLLVVDTRHLPRNVFLHDLEAINYFERFSDCLEGIGHLRRGTQYYFGEYLSQGYLDVEGKCSQTSLQQLIDYDIFQFCPVLENPANWRLLVNQIVALRAAFHSSPLSTRRHDNSTTGIAVFDAVGIAHWSFGPAFALPIAIMILSMTPRNRNDPGIAAGLLRSFSVYDIEHLHETDFGLECNRLPELAQYRKIVCDLRNRIQRSNAV